MTNSINLLTKTKQNRIYLHPKNNTIPITTTSCCCICRPLILDQHETGIWSLQRWIPVPGHTDTSKRVIGDFWKIAGRTIGSENTIASGKINADGYLEGLPKQVQVPQYQIYGLLIGCLLEDGTIAWPVWAPYHIYWYTQGGQHPWCVEYKLEPNIGHNSTDNMYEPGVSGFAHITQKAPWETTLSLRWRSGHSPYPEIEHISVYAFNRTVASRAFPMYPDDFVKVAKIKCDIHGNVYVNGNFIKKYEEFIPE